MRNEYLLDNGWTEPLDESPFDTLEGWEGGAVKHTGGNIFCRIWRNEDAQIEVIYGMDGDGVEADKLVEDDDYGLINNGDMLELRRADEVTDEAKIRVAEEMIYDQDRKTEEFK